MSDLAEKKCVACNADAVRVSADEQTSLLAELDGWVIDSEKGTDKLARTFDFPNFVSALNFANAVGELAEAEDHHPQLIIEWGRVDVCWWTHAISGLHLNDFIMAARCDELRR
ncbi:MAG: 4a-hydroxytetrahydrobiopterin dehydratase [Gammaproteobacteria bacterium]|nr:4a-hydroxytetrahydrobiopterin dehydratase [Gammaproteobacteria bacterium]